LTVDGWIVADEAAFLTDEVIAARPMRPATGGTICHASGKRPHGSVLVGVETGGESWLRIQVTVDVDPTLYKNISTKNATR
jgi:hypothetical protein